MSKSNDLENDVLNHQYRTATWAKPSNVWVALFNTDPGEAGGGTELTLGTGGYARVQVAVADASWNAPADDGSGRQRITNASAITFPNATADYSHTANFFAIMSAATGGTVRHYGALTTPRTILNGDTNISFAAGTISIAEG